MNDLWIPITLAICLTIILLAYFYFNSRNRIEVQKTIRDAISKGGELTPEHIAEISNIKPSKMTDLRRGIILLALGVAILLAGVLLGFTENMAAIAMFPIMLGCGFLTTWKLNSNA
jgi:hypothetical protein